MMGLWRALGRPHRTRFMLALGLSACAGAFGIGLLGLSGWFLTASALAGMSGSGLAFNHLFPSAGVRAVAFGRVLTRYGEQLVGHDATLRLSARLRPRLFEGSAHAQRGMSPLPAAELSTLIDDVDAAEAGFLRILSPLAAILASVCVALAFTFAADLLAGLLALVGFVLALFVIPRRIVGDSQRAAEALGAQARDSRQATARLIENAVELDIIGALQPASDAALKALCDWTEAQDRIDLPFRRAGLVIGGLGGLIALFGLWRVMAAGADLPLAVGAALALIAAFDASAAMVNVFSAMSRSGDAALRLEARLRHSDAAWNPPEADAAPLGSLFPVIARDVCFQAAPAAPVIGPLSFTLNKGQAVQLIGPSGKGKSTLAESLMRLHPLTSGVLSYGAIPAAKLRIASVLEHIAIAPQLPAFLPGTLRQQLTLGAPLAQDDDIFAALSIACADGFVRERPEGLDAIFTETTAPFSGGQLRRLGIARALLCSPSLLILDEPFAGLEPSLALRLAGQLADWTSGGERSLLVLSHERVPYPFAGLDTVLIDLGVGALT